MPEDKEEGKETVYDEGGREEQLEDDGLSPEEEAFMKGYDEADGEEKKKKEESDEEEEKEE